MNPKQIFQAVLLVCIVGVAGWLWWPATPPQRKSARQSQEQTAAQETAMTNDNPADEPVAAEVDPALLRAVVEAIAQQQQQEAVQTQMVEDARIDRVVTNNLRQLLMGSEQFFTENGASSVSSVALVGTNSTQYVKQFFPVAGETYPAVILQGRPINATGVSGVRDITISP